ncbi:Sulfate transporter 3.1 [Asimina triloba]
MLRSSDVQTDRWLTTYSISHVGRVSAYCLVVGREGKDDQTILPSETDGRGVGFSLQAPRPPAILSRLETCATLASFPPPTTVARAYSPTGPHPYPCMMHPSAGYPATCHPNRGPHASLRLYNPLSPLIDHKAMGNADVVYPTATVECAHRVAIPPPQPFFKSLKSSIKETFFPDDPLRQFKNQPAARRIVLALHYLFPILEWAPRYSFDFFKSDLVSGITIASLAIPQGISYAKLANLPPILGLYSSFVPPLVYAMMGSSRDLAVGTVAVASLLIASMLEKEVPAAENPTLYMHLAFTATFFAGVFQASLGVLSFMIRWRLPAVEMAEHRLGMLLSLLPPPHTLSEQEEAKVLLDISSGAAHVISHIGNLKKGLNPPSLTDLTLTAPYLSTALKTGIVTGVIALAEGIAVGRSFAMFKGYHIDGNKEMIAFGTMNIVGSCTSCYLTTGPFSRSAVNFNAGCKTAVSNIVMAIAVMITLLLLTPLFHYTPLVVLSAIIVSAMLGLIDYEAALHLWKIDKIDFCVCMGAYLGVVFGSVEIGLVIAVAISILRVLLFISRPRTAVLGNIPNSMIYRNIGQYPDANRVPGILILQIDGPIYFANSSYLRERILRWIDEEEDKVKSSGESSLQYIILDMSAVGGIDTSGISMLQEMKKIMDRRELKLVLANPGSGVMKKLDRSKFIEVLGQEWIYLTVGEAVGACNFMLHTCKPDAHARDNIV